MKSRAVTACFVAILEGFNLNFKYVTENKIKAVFQNIDSSKEHVENVFQKKRFVSISLALLFNESLETGHFSDSC